MRVSVGRKCEIDRANRLANIHLKVGYEQKDECSFATSDILCGGQVCVHSHHGDRKSALSTVRRTVPAIVQLCRCRNLKSALEIDSLAYSDGHPSISFQINRYFSCLSKSQSYCIESDNVNTPNNLENLANLESRSPGCISDTLNFLDFFHGLHRCYCSDQSVRNFCKILTTRVVLKALSK